MNWTRESGSEPSKHHVYQGRKRVLAIVTGVLVARALELTLRSV
jgi:hypothetical protein